MYPGGDKHMQQAHAQVCLHCVHTILAEVRVVYLMCGVCFIQGHTQKKMSMDTCIQQVNMTALSPTPSHRQLQIHNTHNNLLGESYQMYHTMVHLYVWLMVCSLPLEEQWTGWDQ